MSRYLKATGRADVAAAADAVKEYLTGDAEVYANPENYFDRVIEINLSELEPHLNGPFTPDLATPISQMKEAAAQNNWPIKIEVGLIGSCTNSQSCGEFGKASQRKRADTEIGVYDHAGQ
jgi:aconitate hydratase